MVGYRWPTITLLSGVELTQQHTTWNPHVIEVENWCTRVPLKIQVYSTWIYSCVPYYWCWFTRGYPVKFEPYFFSRVGPNPRCICHVDYWCTFSGLFHVNCFKWIIGVSLPVQVDIRWISCEECQPFLFHMFSTCIFRMDYVCTYPRVYLVDIMWSLSLIFFTCNLRTLHFSCGLLVYIFRCISRALCHVDYWCTSSRGYQMHIMWRMPPDFVPLVFHVYFSHGLLVYLSTCISGGYHVMVEPRFPSYVYSSYVFNFLGVLGGLSEWVIIRVSLLDGYYVWWDDKKCL